MDSVDIGHVLPPDPVNFWDFVPDQFRILIKDHTCLRLISIDAPAQRVRVEMSSSDYDVEDWLNLDAPCVALRLPNHEPYVTLTLRKIEGGKAYLQVTVNPKAPQGKRTET